MRRDLLKVFSLLLLVASFSRGQDDPRFEMSKELMALIDSVLEMEDPRPRQDEIWRMCILQRGSPADLLDELHRRRSQSGERPDKLDRILRLTCRIQRRLGDLTPARDTLQEIPEDRRIANDWLGVAEVHDALGDDDRASVAYEKLLGTAIPDEMRNRVLLRLALMKGRKDKDDTGRLIDFARDPQRDTLLRNQAAVVLALKGKQKEAIGFFHPSAESGRMYPQLVRLAEWSLEAGEWKTAQGFAWDAVAHGKTKRDRRYVLALLVEAYRGAGALGELLERFATQSDAVGEVREVWIDLLRETGRVEEALRLFREGSSGVFTTVMRRELLEICRGSGNDDLLVSAYRELIQGEPRFIEWREGLSRFHLERGDRESARKIWEDYLSVTDLRQYRMAAASTLMSIGLDELAIGFARSCMADSSGTQASLMFLFELYLERGRHARAREILQELDREVPPDAAVRREMADAFERLGQKTQAVVTLQEFCEARGERANPDARMKLALLLSEVDREEDAMAAWLGIWRTIESIPRRRYVEERLMTVASRLGKLAGIAVELEKKLRSGQASDRDAGLLVRLYTRVKDAVSATEIIEEHMKLSQARPVDVLAEKARVFLSCEDYFNYEKVIREALQVDPEGRGDYLRQLAMSNLERGQREEARRVLEELKELESDDSGDEFEAGVLALAGMRDLALAAYRRGIARHPERIDTYLLLSNVQKELGRHTRSAGMFQFLAETAEKDDLFIIAIDGILNMRDGRANRGAPDRLVDWARRVTLQRLARRPDKLYLCQLVADLSEELNDRPAAIRALKTALPVAGEQRAPLLRELMEMSKKGRANNIMAISTSMITASGVIRRPAAAPVKKNTDLLSFGRRLLGQGDLVPPQVYLDLGQSFLDSDDVLNASKTFNQASKLPEFAEMQGEIAAAFEKASYLEEALRVYERMLTVEATDVTLMGQVAELHEKLGHSELAFDLYSRGLDLLLDRSPFSVSSPSAEKTGGDRILGRGILILGGLGPKSTDEYQRSHRDLVNGVLACLSGERFPEYFGEIQKAIMGELGVVSGDSKNADARVLSRFPRLSRRVDLHRRLAVGFGRMREADDMDLEILRVFSGDKKLFVSIVRHRMDWGFVASARALIEAVDRPEDQKNRLRLLAGVSGDVLVPGLIGIAEARGLILPLVVRGDLETIRTILERLDFSTGQKSDLKHMPLLVGAANHAGASDAILGICRHWLNMIVRHQTESMYMHVEPLLAYSQMSLNPDQQRSLFENLMDKVLEKPGKFPIFLRMLPELQEKTGPGFVGAEQVEQLIRARLSDGNGFVYGIPELFALIDASERAQILRSIWPLVPKAQRAMFLLLLVPALDKEVGGAFADFIVGSFKTALSSADRKSTMAFYVDELVGGDNGNTALALRMMETLVESSEGNHLYAMTLAMALKKAGRVEEAVKEARSALIASIEADLSNFQVKNALKKMMEVFGRDHSGEMIAALEDFEKENGPSKKLCTRRIDLLAAMEDLDAQEAAMKDAISRFPKEQSFLVSLRNLHNRRGLVVEAMEIQKKLVEVAPKHKPHRTRLTRYWEQLRHPEEALASRDAEKVGNRATRVVRKPGTGEEKKIAHATIPAIKKAVDAGDPVAASRIFRRFWRAFPDRGARGIRVVNLAFGNRVRHLWPKTPVKRTSPAKPAKRPRGGLPRRYLQNPATLGPKPAARVDAGRKTLQEVMVGHASGLDEVRRQLRSLNRYQLDSLVARDVMRALASVEVGEKGREATIQRLVEETQSGRAGKVEYGMLFGLLEEGIGDTSALEDTLDGLLENSDALDSERLRRLARLYAKSGKMEKASALYGWCAVMQPSAFGSFNVDASDLLDEVTRNLDVEHRERVVAAILAFGRPDRRYYYGLDAYHRLELETWIRLLGPDKAFERARDVCDAVTDLSVTPLRRASALACWLFARRGEHEEALRCLEVSLCRLEAPAKMTRRYLVNQYTRPGNLSQVDMQRIFPVTMKDWIDGVAWIRKADEQIRSWAAEGRISPGMEFNILSFLALRLHGQGLTREAGDAVKRLQELAVADLGRMLWVADVLREIGRGEEAHDLELNLLRSRHLHVERVPEVLSHLLSGAEPTEALALAEVALGYTRHPDLLKALQEHAGKTGDVEGEARWVDMAKKARLAAEQLKKPRKTLRAR